MLNEEKHKEGKNYNKIIGIYFKILIIGLSVGRKENKEKNQKRLQVSIPLAV